MKLNIRPNNKTYKIEEEIKKIDSKFNKILNHDNILRNTIEIFTEKEKKGKQIFNFQLNSFIEKPWETEIFINEMDHDKLYINYETYGDQVDADDINIINDKLDNITTEGFDDLVDTVLDNTKQIKEINQKNEQRDEQIGKNTNDIVELDAYLNGVSSALNTVYEDIDELRAEDKQLSSNINLLGEKVDKEVEKLNINKLDNKVKDLGRYSFNDVKKFGFYRIYDNNTSPDKTAKDFLLEVFDYNGFVYQRTLSTDSQKKYFRFFAKEWTTWEEINNNNGGYDDTAIKKDIRLIKSKNSEQDEKIVRNREDIIAQDEILINYSEAINKIDTIKLNKEIKNLKSTSFNNVKETGFYKIYHSSTSPTEDIEDYLLEVFAYNIEDYSDGFIIQKATHLKTLKIYKRISMYNKWSAWVE